MICGIMAWASRQLAETLRACLRLLTRLGSLVLLNLRGNHCGLAIQQLSPVIQLLFCKQ